MNAHEVTDGSFEERQSTPYAEWSYLMVSAIACVGMWSRLEVARVSDLLHVSHEAVEELDVGRQAPNGGIEERGQVGTSLRSTIVRALRWRNDRCWLREQSA